LQDINTLYKDLICSPENFGLSTRVAPVGYAYLRESEAGRCLRGRVILKETSAEHTESYWDTPRFVGLNFKLTMMSQPTENWRLGTFHGYVSNSVTTIIILNVCMWGKEEGSTFLGLALAAASRPNAQVE
jgi:hypothetical protein